MPLMKLACTALERVPILRQKIIDDLMKKFHQDLVFCRVPKENDITGDLRGNFFSFFFWFVFFRESVIDWYSGEEIL